METIDATPTWEGILPLLLELLLNGTLEAQDNARNELLRMARIADCYIALKKESAQ